MIWFTSDLHFNHANIIQHCARPFTDVEHMNRSLIVKWNGVVKAGDTVYVLGDFGYRKSGLEDLQSIFNKLAGNKVLVKGNHDEANPQVLKLGWSSIHDLLTVRLDGVRFICCHYPLESWRQAHRGYIHLHGHCHGSLKRKIPHRFDVGVDVRHYQPVSAEALIIHAGLQEFDPQDHHSQKEG